MQLGTLDHVNVRTNNLEAMTAWYTEILGMHAGDRPQLQTAGAWMYVGDHPVVHLVSTTDESLAGSECQLKLEHFGEHNWSPYECFPGMHEYEPGKYRVEKFGDRLPLLYSIVARK